MRDRVGDSMARKTTRLQTGSFLGGGERRIIRVCDLLVENIITPEREQ
jgi:hypothetical protein